MLDMTTAINCALEKPCEHAEFLRDIFGFVPPTPAPRPPTLVCYGPGACWFESAGGECPLPDLHRNPRPRPPSLLESLLAWMAAPKPLSLWCNGPGHCWFDSAGRECVHPQHYQIQPVTAPALPPTYHCLETFDQFDTTPPSMSAAPAFESAPEPAPPPASPSPLGSVPTSPRARSASPRRRSNSKGIDLRKVFGSRIGKCPDAAFRFAPVLAWSATAPIESGEEEEDDDASETSSVEFLGLDS
ncbi:hypothetical protein BU16DRAFT_539758 [Lophium mytilinum]|uniref:Uncharacterized protein n=1 Tax=Lophium mytilinum TaxID=390894 RepID=A0A6A6QQM7_9PEZI|nr:hypothetical protein BU16DRAFT_539758 [Lophium mytilinum]